MNLLKTENDIRWGPQGKQVFKRTYSRIKEDGANENWLETVTRVVDGNLGLVGSEFHLDYEREKLIDLIYTFRAIPAGRHLWTSGVKGRQFVRNCHRSGWSSKLSEHFTFLFDELMKGGGVGANYSQEYLLKAQPIQGKVKVKFRLSEMHNDFRKISNEITLNDTTNGSNVNYWTVADTREGWVDALGFLIDSFTNDDEQIIVFDLSKVRAHGEIIRGFGGTASGPGPLAHALIKVTDVLNNVTTEHLTPIEAMSIDHAIAQCVVAGNIRRSARMSILHWEDPFIFDFIDCKRDHSDHWTTNISVEVDDRFFSALNNDDSHAVDVFNRVTEAMLHNGEPGFYNSSKASEGELRDVRASNPCFHPDTKIAVADGRGAVSIEELAEVGKDVPVYSMNPETGKVEIKWGRNPRLTGENMDMVEIEFNDGSTLRVTPDHKFYLLNGEERRADELQMNDSLPAFTKRQEPIKSGGLLYWRVRCDVNDPKKDQIYEHRDNPEARDAISHRRIMGALERHLREADGSDLETFVDNDVLYVKKRCEQCSSEFTAKWSKRERAYCTITCVSNAQADSLKRKAGVRRAYNNKARINLGKQIDTYNSLSVSLGRTPWKVEWERECRNQDISVRFQKETSNPYILSGYRELQEVAEESNHRVVRVTPVENSDVYNITVDDFHTVGIITREEEKSLHGIYAPQCGEITLEEGESCNLGHVNLSAYGDDYLGALEAFSLMSRFLIRATFATLTNEKQAEVEARNRRIGVGFFGFQEWLAELGIKYSEASSNLKVAELLASFKNEVIESSNDYADQLNIPRPIKHTTVAPTGTIAKLPGTTEGAHPVYSRFYERRVRYAANDPRLDEFIADHEIEDCVYSPNTKVVVFHTKDTILDKVDPEIVEQSNEISVYDMLATQAVIQEHYADNAVSFTVNVDPALPLDDLREAMLTYLPNLKGTTIMPDASRPQSPYTRITKEQWEIATDHEVGQGFDECASGSCPIK